MGSSSSTVETVINRTKEWTPGWYPGMLCSMYHYSDRGPYNNSINVSSTSSPYLKGVMHVSAIQLWWLMIALLLLFMTEFRRYLMIPVGTICVSLRLCICVMACAFLAVICLQLFFHVSVVSAMPAITMHPADNGEIMLYMKRVEAQMNSITAAVMERYYGSAIRMSIEPVYVHKVLENILRSTDELMVTHRSPRQARPIHTPVKVLILSCEWTHFLTLMTYWASALLIMALLAVTRCYFVAACLGVILCGLGACLQTMVAVVAADGCFDPRYTLYTLKTHEFYRYEEVAIQEEYVRVCTEWFAKFELLIEHYEKNFMYAAYELHSRAMASEHHDDWRYLDETADKIYNVSRDDVSELRNILPPRCRPNFTQITDPVRPEWTTPRPPPHMTQPTTIITFKPSYSTAYWNPFREPVTAPPYYTHPVQGPRFLPPYDVVLRALCSGDRKLMLLTLQIGLLILAQTIVILILIYAFLSMTPPNTAECKLPCLKHTISCSTRSCWQKEKKAAKKRKKPAPASKRDAKKKPGRNQPRQNKLSRNQPSQNKLNRNQPSQNKPCKRRTGLFCQKNKCKPKRSKCVKKNKCNRSCVRCGRSRCRRPSDHDMFGRRRRCPQSNLSLAYQISKLLNGSFSSNSCSSCKSRSSPNCLQPKCPATRLHKFNRKLKRRCSSYCQTCPMQNLSSCQTCFPARVESICQTRSPYIAASTTCCPPKHILKHRSRPAHVSYADDVSFVSSCATCRRPIRRRTYVAETRLVECISSHQSKDLNPKFKENQQSRNGKDLPRSAAVNPPSLPGIGLGELLDNINICPRSRDNRVREIYLKFH